MPVILSVEIEHYQKYLNSEKQKSEQKIDSMKKQLAEAKERLKSRTFITKLKDFFSLNIIGDELNREIYNLGDQIWFENKNLGTVRKELAALVYVSNFAYGNNKFVELPSDHKFFSFALKI